MTELGREGRIYDVVVVGAGVAGTVTAANLARAGFAVALIDARRVHPPEFRAEKIGPVQMAQFHRLGVGASVRAVATPVDAIDVVRYGRLHEREARREYGFSYAGLVNRLRDDLPESLDLIIGRVDDLQVGPGHTNAVLADGTVVTARLLVLATGLNDAARRKVGLNRTLLSRRHSLSIGFDLAAPRSSFPFEALTYYGEAAGDRAAYLTVFPIGHEMRANLFVYREPGEDWVLAFRSAPQEQLAALMPRLHRYCPPLAITGPVETRSMDLSRIDVPARDGVVVIGDACQSTCPIPGNGIGKVLVDVERLLAHVPGWLGQPHVTAAMTAQFYADPVKAASDVQALRTSLYARSLAVEPGRAWRLRRLRNTVARYGLHGLYRAGHRRKPQRFTQDDHIVI